MKRSESIGNLALSLAKFQAEVSNPKNNSKNPMYNNSKYASLDEVLNTIRPILGKNELSILQETSTIENNVCVISLLMHKSGEWIETDPLIFEAVQKRKDGSREVNAQGAGSAITYARRYQLSALLGISSEDDDDANNSLPQHNNNENDNRKAEIEQKVKDKVKEAPQEEAAPQTEGKHFCQSCAAKGINKEITKGQAILSHSKYKMQLCLECQNILKVQQKNAAQE